MCSLWIFRLEFPAGGSSLYPLAKVPAEFGGRRRGDRHARVLFCFDYGVVVDVGCGLGPGAVSCRVACAIGGTIGPL